MTPRERRFGDIAGTEWGAGPTVVLLHGNGGDHHMFEPLAARLARDRHVLALDTRAHGRSARGTGPLTIARLAEDLAAVVAELGVDRVDLVGFSDGGNIIAQFAIDHPERVRSAVLVGANLYPAGLRAGARAGIRAWWIACRIGGLVSSRSRRHAEVIDLMIHDPRIDPADLAVVDAPVLVLAGSRDAIVESHTRLIAAALPAGRCQIVPRADHLFPIRKPELFGALVDEFLDEVSPGTD